MQRIRTNRLCSRLTARCAAVVALGCLLGTEAPAATPAVATTLNVGWLSAYVSERRDNFAGSAVFAGTVAVSASAWNLELAHLAAVANDGREWSFGLASERGLGDGVLAFGAAHIASHLGGEEATDRELWAAWTWPWRDGLEIGIEAVHSLGVEGTYWTAAAVWTVPTADTHALAVRAALSSDHGYAVAGFAGPDQVEVGAELVVSLTTRRRVTAFVTQVWPLRGLKRDVGHGRCYGGLSVDLDF